MSYGTKVTASQSKVESGILDLQFHHDFLVYFLGLFFVLRLIGGKATGEVFQVSGAATLSRRSHE